MKTLLVSSLLSSEHRMLLERALADAGHHNVVVVYEGADAAMSLKEALPPPDFNALKEIARAQYQSSPPIWNHPYPPPRRRKRK